MEQCSFHLASFFIFYLSLLSTAMHACQPSGKSALSTIALSIPALIYVTWSREMSHLSKIPIPISIFLHHFLKTSMDIWLQSYEGFDNAKINIKERNLNTAFANISKTTSPTSDSFLLIMSYIARVFSYLCPDDELLRSSVLELNAFEVFHCAFFYCLYRIQRQYTRL